LCNSIFLKLFISTFLFILSKVVGLGSKDITFPFFQTKVETSKLSYQILAQISKKVSPNLIFFSKISLITGSQTHAINIALSTQIFGSISILKPYLVFASTKACGVIFT
jgi:hypothetical protein